MCRNVTGTDKLFPIWHRLFINLTLLLCRNEKVALKNPYLEVILGLNFWRWKFARYLFVLKTCGFVGTIAEGFVRGMPTPAQRKCGSPREAGGAALHIEEFAFPFDP